MAREKPSWDTLFQGAFADLNRKVGRGIIVVLIQITLNRGRTAELKNAFYKRVAEDIAKLGLRKQDVFINLVAVPKENWSFSNGERQYGPQ